MAKGKLDFFGCNLRSQISQQGIWFVTSFRFSSLCFSIRSISVFVAWLRFSSLRFVARFFDFRRSLSVCCSVSVFVAPFRYLSLGFGFRHYDSSLCFGFRCSVLVCRVLVARLRFSSLRFITLFHFLSLRFVCRSVSVFVASDHRSAFVFVPLFCRSALVRRSASVRHPALVRRSASVCSASVCRSALVFISRSSLGFITPFRHSISSLCFIITWFCRSISSLFSITWFHHSLLRFVALFRHSVSSLHFVAPFTFLFCFSISARWSWHFRGANQKD
jgi:hypothetical protein